MEALAPYAGTGWDRWFCVNSVLFYPGNRAKDDCLDILGHFPHLREVHLEGRDFTDRAFAYMKDVPHLESLDVCRWLGPQFTDEGLAHLRGVRTLVHLQYLGARVSDAGLRNLAGLTNLKDLSLECREATDRGLAAFAGLDQLEKLCLCNGRKMTGEGLKALPAPDKLKELWLSYVNDGGMRTVARFTNLRHLELGDQGTAAECPLSGDAIKFLCGLRELVCLSVHVSSIDDRGAPYLVRLPNLRSLDLSLTSMTDASLPDLLKLHSLETLTVPFAVIKDRKLQNEISRFLPRLRYLKDADGEFEFRGATSKQGIISTLKSWL